MSSQKPGFYIEIVNIDTDETIKTLGPYASERLADRAVSGLLINLNSDKYYINEYEVL